MNPPFFINRLKKIAFLGLLCCFSPALLALAQMNMTPGVTEVSQEIYFLHSTILIVCTLIGIAVFSVMFYSLYKHRRSKRTVAANFHESTAVEIIWTLIPFLILIGIAIPATRVLLKMENVEEAALTVKVTGYQWKWHYEYLNENVGFFSNLATPWEEIQNAAPKNPHYLLEVDNPLVIPAGKKVRFLMTSSDVIHSWFVPQFGVKKDAIPGFINETWAKVDKPGVYRGQCTELCGALHGYMPVVVNVVPEPEFERWLAKQKTTHG